MILKEPFMRYAVVIEKSQDNYSAYVPDLPGCITTGETVQETLRNIREAITGHLDALVETGQNIPDPEVLVDYVDVPIPAFRNVN
jgi:predicted RNase H-like HicB family nuclease